MLFSSLYDGPLDNSFLNFLRFSIMPRFPVITCPVGWSMNSDWWQLRIQLRFVVPISKSNSLSVCLKLKILLAISLLLNKFRD